MRKIDKYFGTILSSSYKVWVDKLEADNKNHPLSRTYYNDVVMELYRCQRGVCAYTEDRICPSELYQEPNWQDGKYKLLENTDIKANGHYGELEHFDPKLKDEKYWLWDNLFMIQAKINGIKSGQDIVPYLKPDLEEYSPEKYFDYDQETHRFTVNTDVEDETMEREIKYMMEEVLCLNHGMVRTNRRDYINEIKSKIEEGKEIKIDRFFTSVKWILNMND